MSGSSTEAPDLTIDIDPTPSGHDDDDSSGWTPYCWQAILLYINALLGLIVFEWAWYRTSRFRKPCAEIDRIVPVFRRDDARRWAKWTHYPGAITMMLPRFFFAVLWAFILILVLKVCLICQPMDEPIRGCRSAIIRILYKFFAFFFQLITNFNITTWKTLTMDEVNHYTEWLGPIEEQEKEQLGEAGEAYDPGVVGLGAPYDIGASTDSTDPNSPFNSRRQRIPKRGRGPPSTIVCNHIGWLEIMALVQSPVHCGFTPKDELINVPLLGTCCRGLQSLFINRGGSPEARERIVEQIKERQRQIEDEGQEYNPMTIFAEGTTTNGYGLLKFKRGAFEGMRTVVPVCANLGERRIRPTYEVVDFWPLLSLMLSSFCFHNLKLTIMPPFTPTQWMLNNHKDKGKADWQIFANCVREAMAKQGGFFLDETSFKEKLSYEEMMNRRQNECELGGKTYSYPHGDVSRKEPRDDGYLAVGEQSSQVEPLADNEQIVHRNSTL